MTTPTSHTAITATIALFVGAYALALLIGVAQRLRARRDTATKSSQPKEQPPCA